MALLFKGRRFDGISHFNTSKGLKSSGVGFVPLLNFSSPCRADVEDDAIMEEGMSVQC